MHKVDSAEYKQLVLNIFIKIDKLCRENGIEYCLFYGALLGAVRHGGYIPWDDDIDLIMRRTEYDKLRDLIVSDPDCGLNFIDISTNEKSIYTFAKVCDVRTKAVDKYFIDVDGYGAFVDIFPFDYLPEDEKARSRIMKHCAFLNRMSAIGSRKRPDGSLHGSKRIKGNIAYVFTRLIDSSTFVKRIDRIGREHSKEKTSYVGQIRDPREAYPVDWIFPTEEVQFEGHRFCGPREIDKCLAHKYGDYMKLPPEDKRIPHHVDCWFCADET